jgi:hypothetical protein
MRVKGSKILLASAILVAIVASAVAAYAIGTDNHTFKGGATSHIVAITSGPNATMSSTSYTNLPGMVMSITTTGQTLLDMRFGSESNCTGPAGFQDWCSVQILVDGVATQPKSCAGGPINFAYDGTDTGHSTPGNWQARAIERVQPVSAGTHTIKVQGAVTHFGSSVPVFWTGERILVVQTAPLISTSSSGGCTS